MMAYLHCGCRVVRQSHAATVGHRDPYQLTEEQYQAVLKVLRDQHNLIHRYWHDTPCK